MVAGTAVATIRKASTCPLKVRSFSHATELPCGHCRTANRRLSDLEACVECLRMSPFVVNLSVDVGDSVPRAAREGLSPARLEIRPPELLVRCLIRSQGQCYVVASRFLCLGPRSAPRSLFPMTLASALCHRSAASRGRRLASICSIVPCARHRAARAAPEVQHASPGTCRRPASG